MSKQRSRLYRVVRFLLKIPWWAGENPFFSFLVLLLFALFISAVVFYHYVFLPGGKEVESEVVETRFDEPKLQEIIQTWQEQEEKFNQAGMLQVRNIFIPS